MPLFVVLLVGALAAGCGNKTIPMMGQRSSSSGMMGQRSGFGAAMLGSIPHGYRMSRLTCAAPSALPGTTVYVMLGDMGMTRMMGGVAPMGSHMMMRAVPATVPAGKVSFVVGNMGWRTHEMVVLPLAPGQAAGQTGPGGRRPRGRGWESRRGVGFVCRWIRRRHQGWGGRMGDSEPLAWAIRSGVQPPQPLRQRDAPRVRGYRALKFRSSA